MAAQGRRRLAHPVQWSVFPLVKLERPTNDFPRLAHWAASLLEHRFAVQLDCVPTAAEFT